jgi:hypothetical protein
LLASSSLSLLLRRWLPTSTPVIRKFTVSFQQTLYCVPCC